MEKDDKGSTLIRIGVSGESSFWYRPTRVVPDQRPLNDYVCVCSQCAMKLNEMNIYLVFFLVTQQAKNTHFTVTVGKTIQILKKCQ